MKAIYTFLLAIVFTLPLFAQDKYFELTPNGFVSVTDTSKNFVVLDFDGKSQSELFKKFLITITTDYRSPQDVISKVENEVITINGIESKAIRRNKLGHNFDINYTVSIHFKDGKVKIDAPTFKLTTFTDKLQTLHLNWTRININGSDLGIYGKKGKLNSEMAKNDLENMFNKLVDLLIRKDSSNGSDDW